VRDEVVDYVRYWSERTELATTRVVDWIGLGRAKFYTWRRRYGCVNEHNAWVPRDTWLESWEKQAIVAYHNDHPLEGYRRLTYMMLDANVVAASASSVYRVLKQAGLLQRWNRKPSKKGTGFVQPNGPHAHWHTDITYINICGTFYYLCSILDGYSRYIVHWEIRESMKETDVEIIVQRAREEFPDQHPRLISDNGPQFIARDFKEFIRLSGMTHVRTSPFHPQSNGKLERWHQSVKAECIRPGTPLSLDDARRIVARFVNNYNTVRLHSAIGYVAPKDKLEGREMAIFAERDRKLDAARERRRTKRLGRTAKEDVENKLVLTARPDRAMLHNAGETDAGSAGEQPARDNRPGHRRSIAEGTGIERRPLPPCDTSEIPLCLRKPSLPKPGGTH
jgi:putative transposase